MSGYNGYLFAFGEYKFPRMIRYDTYEIAPNRRLDYDSYEDANGLLHRNALDHTATTVTFTVRTRSEEEHIEMMDAIRAQYISENERDATCTYYDTEYCDYKTGHFYLDSNATFKVYSTADGSIRYSESELNFVEY